jgi:PII-like signaling protein/nucleotide-binding universal stress UspA family protein
MFHRILTLLDTTPGCRLALEYGVTLARQAGAELHLVGVAALPSMPGEIDELRELEEDGRAALTPVVRTAREYAEGRGQPVTTEILVGPPAEIVLRVIPARGIDLIVVGQSGDELNAEWRHVVRRASCPVFVARQTVVAKHEGAPDHKVEHWEVRRDRRERIEGRGRMMRVFVGENDQVEGRPVYELIVQRLRAVDVAGATVYRGILGYGAAGRLHRSRLFSHHRPVIVTAVDTAAAIELAIEAVQDLVTDGLIVCSNVEIVKYSHTHPLTAGPDEPGQSG